ncbi:MAG: heavy-metal-associated domain-containing protein [Chitinophagaceae bacterium]
MKALKIFSLAAIFSAVSMVAVAQTKTETFKVSGNCGMCKSKIEKTAKDAGATEASWDEDTKNLTVTYSSSSTNTAKIQQKIAKVGYDNAGFKSSMEDYNKLPGCCKYEKSSMDTNEGMMPARTTGSDGDCCKDGKCTMEGHDGKDCCKKTEGKMPARTTGSDGDCCKDGKCTKEGHDGKDCCKKEGAHKH